MPSTPRRAAIVVAAVLTAVTPVTCSSGDAAPPHDAPSLAGAWVAIPSGSDIRVPTRALSAAKQGEGGASGCGGCPCRSGGGYSVPPTQPCRNEDGICLFQAELHVSPRVDDPGAFHMSFYASEPSAVPVASATFCARIRGSLPCTFTSRNSPTWRISMALTPWPAPAYSTLMPSVYLRIQS